MSELIEKLEATIIKLESESTGDKISLAKCHERSRGKDKRIANLQATIAKLRDALKSIRDANFISLSNPGESHKRFAALMRKTARAALKQEN